MCLDVSRSITRFGPQARFAALGLLSSSVAAHTEDSTASPGASHKLVTDKQAGYGRPAERVQLSSNEGCSDLAR